ncbi:1-(5-phosphoribosyl)-5-[(5-phosphoribosylamino)methylideneamino]imidazole-4-carboxamide isomerase [Flavobacterium sedimenticola]|uniref:1-(5-phosphoribosyl)-5-[(5-phosphoribosylamino)methylideneamino] imidazole-4-carboxamide isomerase n=1 Tax=Flavobacterium sedimenticola TaxID=3043286 RepID=A0ABT6XM85_9FLAO|nr:1-(5-phosphoribosyl)-5-[(5-phosphoribosylamino)methylideneamino]imidazole-4-carboxamide isomerase [Flavobacterium sedimenticola]MDI9256191.1 1-(5-phosphoribosyl)-5-[(5-phosphoribosylamino)methylideneamino]imidazole-4-carboxamide isomerase [Flavobacterium sedimenticola]
MRIIPAIDLINGKCVRLTKGDYNTQKIYNENPLEVAKYFEDNGIRYLHLVDLDGAKSNQIINHKVLYEIASKTNLTIDFGGGLKSRKDLEIAFENGARQVTGGSIAAKNPVEFLSWLTEFGSDKIILGADCLNRKIATHGWLETSELDVIDYISNYISKGISAVICTDIAKDGMLQGTSTELYSAILENTKVNLIASGGVTILSDLALLKTIGCEGAIIGKALYEGTIKIENLRELC